MIKLKLALRQADSVVDTLYVQPNYYRPPIQTTTLMEWINTWLTTYKQPSVRESTYKGICYLIKNHFKDQIFDMNISQIMPLHIENFLNALQFDRVKENAHIYLKDIFNKAKTNRLIEHNPMQSMKKPTHVKAEKRALTIDEQRQFELLCLINHKYTLLLVALWQGLRLGELRALEWADIDFDNNEIHINKKNMPLYILQSWIGHVQGSAVTAKVYTHKQTDAELDAINKVIV